MKKRVKYIFTLKAFRKRKKKQDKAFKKKMLKRFDIDPKTHPLFINPYANKSVNSEAIEKIIMEARKRDRRRYLKKVQDFLKDADN